MADYMVNHMRHTRSQTANRRSHHALKAAALTLCKNCGAYALPHKVCLSCGFYDGKLVLKKKAPLEKKGEKKTETKAKGK